MLNDHSPWRRKHDGGAPPIVAVPERHMTPEPELAPSARGELMQVIREANALPQPTEIRAVGSGWALSEAAVTNRWILETHPLKRTLYDVIPGCLSPGARALLTGQPVPADPDAHDPQSWNLYHVEAGVRLFDLYSRLDGEGDSSGPGGEMPTTRAGLDAMHPVLGGRWALPTMGGAGGQTLAGAFSTGTHGGDVAMPPIADAVEAIHLLGADEREYWIERGFIPQQTLIPLTDDQALRAVYGKDLQIIRDRQLFDAVLVSAGRFGIIYSVVLRVVRQFGLRETRTRAAWSTLRPRLADPADPLHAGRFLQVVVNPHRSGDNTCFITQREAVPRSAYEGPPAMPGRAGRSGLNAGQNPPLGIRDFLTDACSRRNVGEVVADLESKLGLALFFAILFAPFLIPVITSLMALLAGFAGKETLGEVLATLINRVAASGDFRMVAMINDFALGSRQGEASFTDVSYAIMDFADYTDVNCITAADSLEVVFDASGTAYLDFVDGAAARLDQLHAGTLVLPDGSTVPRPMTFGGYLSLRYTGRTTALIGMQQWPRCVHIEIAGLKGIAGNDAYLRVLERDAIAAGATVHWGQANRTTVADVQAMYPFTIEAWRDQLARVTRNGRHDCFSTRFTRERGLEVIQPRIATFEPESRRYLAMHEPFTVTWNAEDNPRATRLEAIGFAGSPLGIPRRGTAGFPVAEGTRDVQLVATRTLGPLTRTDATAPITLVGVGPTGYFHPLAAKAVPRVIDGAERWVVELELGAAEWSAMLHAGNLTVQPGRPGVRVRKAGATDVLLSPGVAVAFLETVPMIGTWQLIGPPVTPGAPPPVLGITVRVRS